MANWSEIQALTPAPGEPPDFEACLEVFPRLELAKLTPQDPRFHAEGDVWTHTKMVVEALVQHQDYANASPEERTVVFLAALLHDVAKWVTTVIDPITGAIKQPGHSRKGAIDARIFLWEAGAPFTTREAICRLIGSHQVPFWVMEGSRREVTPEFLVRELSWQMNIHLLAMLAEADMRGRIGDNQQHVLDNIELFRELAKEEGCYTQPRAFVDAHTRVSYFRGASVHPDYALHQLPGSKVTVMCGLPASGKDRWVRMHRPGLPVVSFDDARAELGLKHGANDGVAAHHAVDKAKALLRAQAPFVWNATHLSESMREKTLSLLYAYHAEVEIIYLEHPKDELLRRNSKRDSTLRNRTLEGMTLRWEIPVPTEVHAIRYLT